ncbi:MAG: hypothetical protein LBD21_04380 [Tannerellaceae bacterium]|jgi:hypothetical protein|nr:hypothetical protein [Tannerellaceae bacterium]
MHNKFILTFVMLMVVSLLGLNAQDRSKAFDKEAFLIKRKAFFTSELGLTPREVEQFIPLVEELQEKKFEAGQRCRKLTRDIRRKSNPSDDEYIFVIDECLKMGLKEAELEREYYDKFKKVLSPEKLYRYKEVEFKFVREFLNEDSNMRNQAERRRGDKREE